MLQEKDFKAHYSFMLCNIFNHNRSIGKRDEVSAKFLARNIPRIFSIFSMYNACLNYRNQRHNPRAAVCGLYFPYSRCKTAPRQISNRVFLEYSPCRWESLKPLFHLSNFQYTKIQYHSLGLFNAEKLWYTSYGLTVTGVISLKTIFIWSSFACDKSEIDSLTKSSFALTVSRMIFYFQSMFWLFHSLSSNKVVKAGSWLSISFLLVVNDLRIYNFLLFPWIFEHTLSDLFKPIYCRIFFKSFIKITLTLFLHSFTPFIQITF